MIYFHYGTQFLDVIVSSANDDKYVSDPGCCVPSGSGQNPTPRLTNLDCQCL